MSEKKLSVRMRAEYRGHDARYDNEMDVPAPPLKSWIAEVIALESRVAELDEQLACAKLELKRVDKDIARLEQENARLRGQLADVDITLDAALRGTPKEVGNERTG